MFTASLARVKGILAGILDSTCRNLLSRWGRQKQSNYRWIAFLSPRGARSFEA